MVRWRSTRRCWAIVLCWIRASRSRFTPGEPITIRDERGNSEAAAFRPADAALTGHVRVEVKSTLIAESSRPYLLLKSTLPVCYYLPREDVRKELLTPSETRTVAHTGHASYWSLEM
jgi:uncharacterized protein (DUF427 family)